MAYSYEVGAPRSKTPGDQNRYLIFTIVETDVGPDDYWAIPSLDELVTVTFVATEITNPGSGGIGSVQVELSREETFDPTKVLYVDKAAGADSLSKITENKRLPPGEVLYGRSNVDVPGGADSVITTVLVVALGHAP